MYFLRALSAIEDLEEVYREQLRDHVVVQYADEEFRFTVREYADEIEVQRCGDKVVIRNSDDLINYYGHILNLFDSDYQPND